MQLLICVCIAWLTISLFAIIPKKLFILDFVFLYGILLSITSTTFTILELNFHIIKEPMSGTNLWAVTVFRVITVPLLILISMNALYTLEERISVWIIFLVIWVVLTTHDWALYRFKVIGYNLSYTFILLGIAYLSLIFITWGFTWWYKRFDHKKARHS